MASHGVCGLRNLKLTPNVTLYGATQTSRRGFQEMNREAGARRLGKLVLLYTIRDQIAKAIGLKLLSHSGFRCDELNKEIGGSKTSQHVKAEADDFSPIVPGENGFRDRETVYAAFRDAVSCLRANKIMFGQIIFEEKDTRSGKVYWIHFSLGVPFRDLDKCGQVMSYKDGKYLFIERISFPDWE